MKRLLGYLLVVIALLIGTGGVGRLETHADAGAPFNGWLSLSGGSAQVPFDDEIGLDPANGSITIEGWINNPDFGPDGGGSRNVLLKTWCFFLEFSNEVVSWPPPGSRTYSLVWYNCPTGNFPCAGTEHQFSKCNWWEICRPVLGWSHFAYVYDHSANHQSLFWNGLELPWYIGQLPGVTTNPLVFANADSMDEFRISSSARYSASFTPPTAPFECDGNTLALWHFDEIAGSTTFHDACGTVDNMAFGYNGAHTEGVSGSRVYLPLVVK